MQHILTFVLCLVFPTIFCFSENICDTGYSVKNRWVIKASVSPYKNWNSDQPSIHIGYYLDLVHLPKASFEVEATYAVGKYLEIGITSGFIDGKYIQPTDGLGGVTKQMIAPTFGGSLHFHLLPLFVKAPVCRWDLYLLAKYNGCVLPKTEFDVEGFSLKKYRHVYGVGLGISYFIKNIAGFFSEFSVGQFSYFTAFVNSNTNFRVGIAFKIKKKQL